MEPLRTLVPSGGDVSITRPFATVSEYWRCCSTWNPASRSRSVAASAPRPCTVGIGASPGPLDTVIVTSDPSSASSPPDGRCAATRSSATSSDWIGTTETSKPACCSLSVAFWVRSPTTSGTCFWSGVSSRNAPTAIATSASTASAISAIRRQLRSSCASSSATGSSAITPPSACSSAAMNWSASW